MLEFETVDAQNSIVSDSISIPDDFSRATDELLTSLISHFGLKAPVCFLREVGKCLFAEKIAPTEDILRFFDMIYLSGVSRAENTDIFELYSDDEEIVKTFSDLYTKYNYLTQKVNESIPLAEMSDVASKYLSTLGINAPRSVGVGNDISFADGDGNVLASLSLDDAFPLPCGYENEDVVKDEAQVHEGDELFLILSNASQNEYRRRIDALLKESAFGKLQKSSCEIDGRGILFAVLSISRGASIDLSSICDEENCDDLTALISLYCGKRIVAVSKEDAGAIESLIEAHRLTARRIAVAEAIPSIRIKAASQELNIRANFLRRMFGQRRMIASKIQSEAFAPTKYESVFCSKEGLDTADAIGATALIYKGHAISARYTKECSFVNGMNAVLDSVFSLLAKGIDRKNIGVTLKVSATLQSTSTAVAALLGAYRAMIELCLPAIETEVIVADEDSIFCLACARLDGGETLISDSFEASGNNNAYLISFGRFDDTTPKFMPDFADLRKMCDDLSSLISKNEIVSARAANGSVMSAAKAMCRDGITLLPYLYDGISDETSAEGLIVELREGSRINAPIIGALKKEELCK